MGRPKIGITGPDKGGDIPWFFTAMAVWLSGGRPVRIMPSSPKKNVKVHGLILGGGADIDSATYHTRDIIEDYLNSTIKNKKIKFYKRMLSFIKFFYFPLLLLLRILFSRKSSKPDKNREKLEFHYLDKAIQLGIPVLGICRGMQLINVMFKGSLFEDIKSYYYEEPYKQSILPFKSVILDEHSKLSTILQHNSIYVNALHHQAIDKIGNGLRVAGREKNQIIQAIEGDGHQLLIGVQWHPEYLFYRKEQMRIFKALSRNAGINKSSK